MNSQMENLDRRNRFVFIFIGLPCSSRRVNGCVDAGLIFGAIELNCGAFPLTAGTTLLPPLPALLPPLQIECLQFLQ